MGDRAWPPSRLLFEEWRGYSECQIRDLLPSTPAPACDQLTPDETAMAISLLINRTQAFAQSNPGLTKVVYLAVALQRRVFKQGGA